MIVYIDCEKAGCKYRAEGATNRQAIARLTRHWTALDHTDFVNELIARGS